MAAMRTCVGNAQMGKMSCFRRDHEDAVHVTEMQGWSVGLCQALSTCGRRSLSLLLMNLTFWIPQPNTRLPPQIPASGDAEAAPEVVEKEAAVAGSSAESRNHGQGPRSRQKVRPQQSPASMGACTAAPQHGPTLPPTPSSTLSLLP